MLPSVPILGTLLQGFVVALFVMLNESLQADVSSDFVTEMVALEEQDEAGNTSIPISKWMDAQEI